MIKTLLLVLPLGHIYSNMSRQQSTLVRQSSSAVIMLAETIRQNLANKQVGSKVISPTPEAPEKPGKPGRDKVKSAIDSSEKFREMEEHKKPLKDLLQSLDVDNSEFGLTEERARQRLAMEGPNALTEKKPTPWYVIYWHQISNFFALLLWAGAILCFIVYGLVPDDPSNLYTAIVILVVIFGVGSASFYQEMKSRSIMASFNDFTPSMCQVIREGKQGTLNAVKLVRGDIIKLKDGDKIPADIRIITSTDMKVDNACLTGESEPQVRKAECTHPEDPFETQNLAFFGTSVKEGTCTGVVIFTGDSTFMGRIANLAGTATSEMTTLQKEINFFIKLIACIAITLGAIFLIIGIVITKNAIATITFCIGVIVANVPEGLMTSLTVCITLCAKRMKEKHVLVKNLQSVETMGSTTAICSDKTGTLTENKMTVVHLWYDGKAIPAENMQRVEDKSKLAYDINSDTFQMFQRCGVLNSDSVFDRGIPSTEGLTENEKATLNPEQQEARLREKEQAYLQKLDGMMWYQRPTTGNASEGAIVKFFQPIEDINEFRRKQPLAEYDNVKITIPFNSTNKFQLSLQVPGAWQPPEHRNDHILFMKGAPEKIWALSTRILNNGVEEPITQTWIDKYEEANVLFADQGERVLGFGYLYLPEKDFPRDYPWKVGPPNFPMKDLTFIGLAALEDPPRRGVPEAVLECQSAGIKVIMVTGDQPMTAAAIARKCNIITTKTANELAEELGCHFDDVLDDVDALVVHGNELAKATAEDETLPLELQGVRLSRWLSKKEVVFARTTPAQKLIIVEGHQKLGHIVAVTGDGVNDSPAIKKADIGIAMNIVGSDVAKDSADMLLLDDNFCSIVDGIEEGRLMFDNLKKTIIYALVVNIPELVPVLAYMVLGFPTPMTTIFMLLICVVTDILPAVSYAYEKKELDIMLRKPRNADVDHLVTWKLLFHGYALLGVIQMFGAMYTYFYVMNDFGFPVELLFGLVLKEGCEPADGDIYNPLDKYRGNSNKRADPGCDSDIPGWGTEANPKADLRVWFYDKVGVNDWGDCEYPDYESSVHSDAYYCYGTEGLVAAQGAYFCGIVALQWIDVLINKGRFLNVWHQGICNNIANYGLVLETVVAVLVVYVPGLNAGIGARPLMPLHLFVPAMPFCMIFFFYDEGRKLINRVYKDKMGRPGAIEKVSQY